MADMNHTKLTRLSIQTTDSNESAGDLTVASTASFNCAGIATLTGAVAVSGAATLSGGVTSSSGLTQSGAAAFTGNVSTTSNVKLGSSGQTFLALRKSTVSVALGTVASDSVTTSVTVPNIAIGDPVLRIVPASIWSGAYDDIVLGGRASADSTMILTAVNSTTTAINTAAMNMDVFWLDLA